MFSVRPRDVPQGTRGLDGAAFLGARHHRLYMSRFVDPRDYPGAISSIKRYVTQPKVVFETNIGSVPQILKSSGLTSNDPNNYVENDWTGEFDNLPGSGLGKDIINENNEAENLKKKYLCYFFFILYLKCLKN